MGRKCSVKGCLSDSNRAEDTGVTFHKVPMHPDVRPRWITLCHIPQDKKLVKIIYVCSRHFLRADFCNFKGKKYMLKQGVLPSVFPWDKSKLEAIKAEKKEKQSEDLNLSLVKHETECANIEIKSEMNVETTEVKLEAKDTSEKSKIGLQTSGTPISFTINTRIEALDFNNEWYPARIVEVDYEENEVLIHFEKFSSKYDEWICMNSSRLRPLQATSKKGNGTEQFEVGERCLAAWSDHRKFPATVTKIMNNDTYEVLFDDGFVKSVKAQRMSKFEAEGNKPGQSSPLFEPIKSSKQDRRDKKRKLNVAALFRKRHKRDSSDEKPPKKHIPPVQDDIQQEVKPIEEEEEDIQNWRPRWIKSKPVGIDAMLETADGPRHTTIVPDPRLPPGWAKHLLKKAQGRWDTIIVSPDNKKFRSKTDIRAYLELHPIEGVNDSMFSFALVGGKRQRKSQGLTPAKKTTPVVTPKKTTADLQEPSNNESQILEEQASVADIDPNEQDNLNSLKILFENDAFKCPIEGCGKTFRRENLAQMHVKHYHPEYTKFLDSTPNVADLAYARTVGENLDKSPGPSKTPALKPVIRTSTPKLSKSSQSPVHEPTDTKPAVKVHSPTPVKTKDAEIIKLLSTKPFDKKDSEPIQPLPSGLPTNMYPDIKLKDLLNKAEGMPKRDDLNLKTLCMTRPPAGIKTLLPVVRQPPSEPSAVNPPSTTTLETPRHSSYKRKRGFSENPDTTKGKDRTSTTSLESNQLQLTPKQQTPLPTHHKTLIPLSASLPPQPPPQLVEDATSNAPSLPPNNIIIEGGEVIKIVRMKQEEIINCTCGYTEEDGLMIQCELCLCWQHAYCNNIERESQVPEKYICYICQNPIRERASRKYYHDQDWLRQGTLPTGSYHCRDDEVLQKRFEKLKSFHDLSGALSELRQFMHSLAVKIKIAEAKNHPKLYLWSKPWEKNQLPEKPKQETAEIKPKPEPEECYVKNESNMDKEEKQESDSMLMMILKAGKEVMPKLDLNTLMADNNEPIIPRPEAAIDSADCRLNLLEHIVHQETLVDQRLDDFEKQIDALEEGLNMETEPDYPRTRHTVQMLMRDLDKLRDFSHSTTI